MFEQLCVWEGTTLGNASPKDFENFIQETFGCRAKFCEEVYTLPSKDEHGYIIEGTGGRCDLFFYVHNDDLLKFAVPRLSYRIRWWEDVLGNGNGYLYPQSILDKYPATW